MTAENTIEVRLPPAPPDIASDTVVQAIKAGLVAIYGKRLAGIVLHGSRARGDARPDSDYDVIAFIKNHDRRESRTDLYRLTDELFQQGPPEIEVNILTKDERALEEETIFMHNVRLEGVLL
jgi:predicted nucleotidyltransferase